MTPYHSHTIVAPPRKSSPLPFILFLILVLGLIGYYGYNSSRSATDAQGESSNVAKSFLDGLNGQHYVAADALLSKSARLDTTPKILKQTMDLYTDRYGSWVGADQTYFATLNLGGLDTCKLHYKLRFERGSIPLQMLLVRGYHGWEIDSLSFG